MNGEIQTSAFPEIVPEESGASAVCEGLVCTLTVTGGVWGEWYVIDWGDGLWTAHQSNALGDGQWTHTYASTGTYAITASEGHQPGGTVLGSLSVVAGELRDGAPVPRTPGWTLVADTGGPKGFHRVKSVGTFNSVRTLCGLTGRAISETERMIVPCAGCQAMAAL